MVYAAYLFSGSSGPLTNPNKPDVAHQHDSLPEGALVALADGNYLATFAEGAPQFERQDEPFDTDQFLNAVYTRPSVNALNEPYAVVSAPELNTVYAAKLSASGGVNSYGTALYAYRETGDGWFRWSEVTGWELQALEQASSVEEFRRIVTELNEQGGRSRQSALDEGRSATPRPSDSADQALFAAALGGRVAISLLDRHQYPPPASQAEVPASDVAMTPEQAVAEPERRHISADQPVFVSMQRAFSRQAEHEPPSAVFLGEERVLADLRNEQWNTHDVDSRWSMTSMTSVRNSFTSSHDWGNDDRKFEQQFVVVQGDGGTAVRRADTDAGVILQLFQPTGESDPQTGAPLGNWIDFPQDRYHTDNYLTPAYRMLAHQLSLGSQQGLDDWVFEARNFLAGTLQENGTRLDDGYEARLKLPRLPEEARQASLGVVLDAPEAVNAIRRHEPANSLPPTVERWTTIMRNVRLEQENQRRQARRGSYQGFQPGSPGWNEYPPQDPSGGMPTGGWS